MNDQRRLVDPLEVIRVVDLREFMDAIVLSLDAPLDALQPETVAQALVHLRTAAIEAVERHGQILEKLRAIAGGPLADAIEHLERRTFGIGRSLQHQRR